MDALSVVCNGLVIDARTWKVLALPPRAFETGSRSSATNSRLNKDLAEGRYDIIPVDDGTVVTLYFWDHPTQGSIAALGTRNAFDVSSLRWTGPLTYAEVVYDLATRLYPGFVAATGLTLAADRGETRLDFKTIDRTRCYTFGFRHHDFHPLRSDPERIWQIQHAELVSDQGPQVCLSGGLPGIPEQVVRRADAQNPRETLETLTAMAGVPVNMALEAALEGKTSPVYGFILRANDPASPDVLIASPLLLEVQRLMYERPAPSDRDHVTALERTRYNAMRAYLTLGSRAMFLRLYPEWTAQFVQNGVFVDNIVSMILRHLRTPHAGGKHTALGLIAATFAANIARHAPGLQPHGPATEGIIRDFVLNPAYAVLFLRHAPKPAAA